MSATCGTCEADLYRRDSPVDGTNEFVCGPCRVNELEAALKSIVSLAPDVRPWWHDIARDALRHRTAT